MKELSPSQLEEIAQATFRKTAEISLEHARRNQPLVVKTIADLVPEDDGPAALVVSGGPSIHRNDPLETVRKRGFPGPLVACDGALGHCLRKGIVPRYVVSVDPHPDRIVRWFGDTQLASRRPDDYFRNQDLDEAHVRDELRANEEMIRLVNAHGKGIRAILSTSVSPDIPQRCLEAGMEIYWWNPIFDDYDAPDSLTRRLNALNNAPCMATGGNVGSSAWVFAYAVLRKKALAMVGMDYSYAPGTPLRKTQYFEAINELYPDAPEKAYIEVYNPHLKETWFTDPAYFWYRQSFLAMAEQTEPDVDIVNCSGGGILFGGRVRFAPLESFIDEHAAKAARRG